MTSLFTMLCPAKMCLKSQPLNETWWLPLTRITENFWALCKSTNRKAGRIQTELYLWVLSITSTLSDLDPCCFNLGNRSAVNFNTTGKKLLAFKVEQPLPAQLRKQQASATETAKSHSHVQMFSPLMLGCLFRALSSKRLSAGPSPGNYLDTCF